MRNRATGILPVLLVLFAGGCTDKPGNLLSLITPDILVRDTTVHATASAFFKQDVPLDGRLTPLLRNLVGISGPDTALMLIRFHQLPDRDTVVVEAATLTLRIAASTGASGNTFAVTLHNITGGWQQVTVRADSLPAFDPTPLRTYTFTGLDDSTLVFDLDTALVRIWLRQDEPPPSYGLLLKPTSASQRMHAIRSFDDDSSSYRPTLRVVARGSAGGLDTNSYATGHDSYAGVTPPPALSQQHIVVQAGILYRTRLNFDLSFLRKGTIVNRATMRLQLDTTLSRLTVLGDTVLSAHVGRSADTLTFEALSSQSTYDAAAGILIFDARHIAQSFINGTARSVIIRASDNSETSSMNMYAVFGHLAADSLRPSLNITYTIRER